MLGRLLRTSSFNDYVPSFGAAPAVVTEEVYQNDTCYITDDLRTLLFGTRDKLSCERLLNDRVHNAGGFRLVIAQELGHLTSRNNYQVVLDHSTANFPSASHIPLNELKDYIFGAPVRTIEFATSNDKIKVVKSASIILFTRIFYLNDSSPLRVGISCCVSDEFLPVLTECWTHVSSILDQCEDVLLKYLDKHDTHLLPKDWRARDCLEIGSVLQLFQRKLIPMLYGYGETPRLFLYPMDSIPYIKTWIKYITNWIELKDGPRLKFLPVLLAKLRYDFASVLNTQPTSRVVILTGNMNVANRLIFILTAFLQPHFHGLLQKTSISHGCPSPSARKLSNISATLDFPFDIKPASSSITETNKGWEIPRIKRNPTFSVTSVSSDETGVQSFIQPSSLKSGASSVHYLSSSLNSAHGSYGSWFKKVGQSPSSKSNESGHEIPSIINRNNSSTSLHQQALLGNVNVSQRVTPQPSPTITEFEEYPWFGDSPRAPEKRTPTPMAPSNASEKRANTQAEIYDVDMKRTVNRLVDERSLDDAFAHLVIEQPKFSATRANERHGEVVEIQPNSSDLCASKLDPELLPRFTSYIPSYNQWFQLQACQISPESETKIIRSMKRDLSLIDTDLLQSSVSTLVISLRSREIKQITIVKDSKNRFVQRTKKIFQNGKIGPVSRTMLLEYEAMDQSLKMLNELNHTSTTSIETLAALFHEITTTSNDA